MLLRTLAALLIALASTAPLAAEDAYTLSLTALVDGSGVFVFTDGGAKYEHKSWKPPQFVVLNDQAWDDLKITPVDWSNQRGKLDLSQAKIIKREGRDIIALEHTDGGFLLFVADAPNAAEPYAVTIRIPIRAAVVETPKESSEPAPSATPSRAEATATPAVRRQATAPSTAPAPRSRLFGGRLRLRGR